MDRVKYTRLGRADVEALVDPVIECWPSQFSGFAFLRVGEFSAGGQSHWVSVWQHAATGLEFVLVPGGRFQMGSPASEVGRSPNEGQHWITLDPFLIARTECTQAAWAKVAHSTSLNGDPSHFESSSSLPVETVSAEDADTWCRSAGLNLPTEAQWEFACRAGTASRYAFGLRINSGQACFHLDWEDGPSPVGSLASNAFGMFDVHGNLWEWCQDFYQSYDTKVEDRTGLRTGTSELRVFRGGCFDFLAGYARSAYRGGVKPGDRARNIGFRPALGLP